MANKRITDVDTVESLNSYDSIFINQNNSLKQISKNKITFDIASGGTGANNAEEARANLGAVSIQTSTITIPASAWVQNEDYEGLYYADMTGLVKNVVDDKVPVFVAPAENPIENYNVYVENKIRACEQLPETINFIADIKPEVDVVVNCSVFA